MEESVPRTFMYTCGLDCIFTLMLGWRLSVSRAEIRSNDRFSATVSYPIGF